MIECCGQEVVASNDVRSAIAELRQILSTPIRLYDNVLDTIEMSSDTGSNSSSVSTAEGRRSSESDCPNDADLPGLITRVLGKRQYP